VWQHLEAAAQVRLTVIGTTPPSRPTGGQRPAAHAKAEILTAQLGDLRPEGRHDPVTVDGAPYGRMLSGLRGVRLAVLRVDAKFTCDVHNPTDHRERVTAHLQERGHGLDAGASRQQRRHRAAIGDWQNRRNQPRPEGPARPGVAGAAVGTGPGGDAGLQLGSALSMPVISTVGSAGTASLRLTAGALIFLALARPRLRTVLRHDVPALLALGSPPVW